MQKYPQQIIINNNKRDIKLMHTLVKRKKIFICFNYFFLRVHRSIYPSGRFSGRGGWQRKCLAAGGVTDVWKMVNETGALGT